MWGAGIKRDPPVCQFSLGKSPSTPYEGNHWVSDSIFPTEGVKMSMAATDNCITRDELSRMQFVLGLVFISVCGERWSELSIKTIPFIELLKKERENRRKNPTKYTCCTSIALHCYVCYLRMVEASEQPLHTQQQAGQKPLQFLIYFLSTASILLCDESYYRLAAYEGTSTF